MSFSNIMDSNAYAGGGDDDPLIVARERVLGPANRLFYDRPVHLVRGQGSHVFDVDGVRYLDAYNNVASVGHAHPHVLDAVMRQMSMLNTHSRYLHRGIVDYSERLLSTMPNGINQVMYASSGSEVNDLALRVAEIYTGAKGVIVTKDAYHGSTATVMAISPSLGDATTLGPHVRTVPPPDSYRFPDAAARFSADVASAVDDLCAKGIRVSCLIVDSMFSSDGIYPDPTVLGPAVDVVHRHGGVFIADEVQAGFARTGESMWGFSRHGVIPDIVTMAKPMGNGMPVAAMAASDHVLWPFAARVPYFSTYGGSPVSMAAASAVLDVIETEGLLANAAEMGTRLRTELSRITEGDTRVGDIRGAGLYIGVEMVSDREAKTPDRADARRLVNALRERHVLISVCGHDGNVLKIRPPLVFSSSDVDWFCTEFQAALAV